MSQHEEMATQWLQLAGHAVRGFTQMGQFWHGDGDVIRNLGSGTALTCCDSRGRARGGEPRAVSVVRRRQRHLLGAGPLLDLLPLLRRSVKAPALGWPMLGWRPLLLGLRHSERSGR